METKDTYTEKMKAPLMPDYFKSQENVVYTPNSSIDVFNETLVICSQMNGSIVKRSASPLKFNIKAIFKNQIDLYVPVVINFLFTVDACLYSLVSLVFCSWTAFTVQMDHYLPTKPLLICNVPRKVGKS